MRSQKGFSIIQLLIVIVVIGILIAAYVAYTHVSSSAQSDTAKAAATSLQKKVKAFDQNRGYYPGDATNSNANKSLTDLNSYAASALTKTSIKLGTANAKNGETTIEYQICDKPSGATGYKIFWWDYSTDKLTSTPYSGGGNTTTCTHFSIGS